MAKAKKYRLAQIVERFGGEIIGDAQTQELDELRIVAQDRGAGCNGLRRQAG